MNKFILRLLFVTFVIVGLFGYFNQIFASPPAPIGPECEFTGEIIKTVSWSTPLNFEGNDNNFTLQVKITDPTKLIFENSSYPNFTCDLLKNLTIDILSDTRLETGTVQHLKKSDFASGKTISGRIHVNLNSNGLPENTAEFTSWYSMETSTCIVSGTSCCKNGNCIKIFDDGLPSACSSGNLPEFSGCDASCKPITNCGKIECKTNKDCWDKNKSCNNVCENEKCVFDSLTSSASLGHPNCLEGIDVAGPQDVLCTPDKKKCSDGSYVERAGFKCEFMLCPEVKVGFWVRILNWFKNLF